MCTLIAILLSMQDCLPTYRPYYQEMWVVYGPTPDCLNRDRHIHYLSELKTVKVRSDDTVTIEQYDRALDLYIERLEWYCKNR
jgi:hypothetical protein